MTGQHIKLQFISQIVATVLQRGKKYIFHTENECKIKKERIETNIIKDIINSFRIV